MKPYLVDVPVRVNIWIRPECQKRQFEVIKQARPSIIFLQSDGGRNEKEWAAIYENRKLIDEGIDWDCKVYRVYEDHNNGLYAMSYKVQDLIWNTVDRCVFLEDDYVPSVSFFRFCEVLLEKYKNDERIECICGMNHEGITEEVNSDYFFSREGSVWGTATWKRVIESGKKMFEYANDPYVLKLLEQRTKHNKFIWEQIIGYAKDTMFGGHIAGGEFKTSFDMYGQNRLQIIPKKNMICNIGFGEEATHATAYHKLPRGIRRVFNMKTYEYEFPLKEAQYVIPDIGYEKRRNRIMAQGHPEILFFRKVESLFLSLKYDGVLTVIRKMTRKLSGKNTIEK